jgi:glycerol-3-phosphate dehydrogenase
VPKSQTRTLKLLSTPAPEATPRRFEDYGTNARELEQLIENDPRLDAPLFDDLPYKKAHCVWAIQNEMARTIEDILARRTRALFLNARSALQAAPAVLDILTQELALEPQAAQQQLQSFTKLAIDYGCQ